MHFSPGLGVIMTFTAGLTAFYMFRLYYRIFHGKKYQTTNGHTPHESPVAMTLPLVFLGVVTIFAGFIPFGKFVSSDGGYYHIHIDPTIATISVVVALAGIGLATWLYRKENDASAAVARKFNTIYRAAYHRFYIDELYLFITKKIIFKRISSPVAWFDRHIVDGTMNGLASVTQWVSLKIKGFQSGKIQHYAFVILLGTLIIAAIVIFI